MKAECVINSLEISRIVKARHSYILRKIQGSTNRKGFIQYLNSYGFEVDNYLRVSNYIDSSGKNNICYDFTRLGWQVFINLFTGNRGNLLSDAYVKKFGLLED